jgi:DNA repair protein RadC
MAKQMSFDTIVPVDDTRVKEMLRKYLRSGELASMVQEEVAAAPGEVLNDSRGLFNYLAPWFASGDQSVERFAVIFMTAKNRVIKIEEVSAGSVSECAVYPREIVKKALAHGAAAVIFAHNHPSGDPAPSAEDTALTRRLVFACHAVGVQVHEHIIIGRGKYRSFADDGYIADYKHKATGHDE